MFGTTMMLTVGQALDRARNDGTVVRIQVGNETITGRVLNTDSQGIVVADENGDVCVARMDAVSCVRIPFVEVEPGQIPAQPTDSRL